MRVVFLTHYYPPELGAAQTRIAGLARGLLERGHSVVVHTGVPHYPTGRVPDGYRNRWRSSEVQDGVRVVRSLVYATPNRGFVRRIAGHSVLAASSVVGARATGPADVVVAESPPLFTAGGAIAYAASKRAPLVLNVSDRWPESAVQLGALRQPVAVAAAEALERHCYRSAAAITAPTQGIVDVLRETPQAAGKVVHIPPAVDVERFSSVPEAAPTPGGPLRVLYAGTLGMAQGVGVLVEAARLLDPTAVHVSVVGAGPDEEALRARATGLHHVGIHGAVAANAIPGCYASCEVSVVCLRDRPIFAGALPTKLFESMAAGRAVVLCARGEAARLVEEHGAGVVVPPEDPAALAGALAALAADPDQVRRLGRAGRMAAAEYGRQRAVERWEELLLGVVPLPGP